MCPQCKRLRPPAPGPAPDRQPGTCSAGPLAPCAPPGPAASTWPSVMGHYLLVLLLGQQLLLGHPSGPFPSLAAPTPSSRLEPAAEMVLHLFVTLLQGLAMAPVTQPCIRIRWPDGPMARWSVRKGRCSGGHPRSPDTRGCTGQVVSSTPAPDRKIPSSMLSCNSAPRRRGTPPPGIRSCSSCHGAGRGMSSQ